MPDGEIEKNLTLPRLGETMNEGTVVAWLKQPGEKFHRGEPILEVESDKINVEVPALEDGQMVRHLVSPGDKIEVETAIATILAAGRKSEKRTAASGLTANQTGVIATAATPAPNKRLVAGEPRSPRRHRSSPVARRLAQHLNIPLEHISGTGPRGRVTKADVLAAAVTLQTRAQVPESPPVIIEAEDKRISLSTMRKAIASRLLQAKATIPHFYLQVEIDAEPLVKLSQELNISLEAEGIRKITVSDFVLKATAVAATRVPQVNTAFDGTAIVQFANVQLACALSTDDGLVTPVLRVAQKKSLTRLSAEIQDLADRARSKTLKPEDERGGTITVSNLGGYGVERFLAIVNPPQSVIVSVGTVVRKPVLNAAGSVVAGQRMTVGVSCDHRVVDGAVGARFLSELKELLENPAAMLI